MVLEHSSFFGQRSTIVTLLVGGITELGKNGSPFSLFVCIRAFWVLIMVVEGVTSILDWRQLQFYLPLALV